MIERLRSRVTAPGCPGCGEAPTVVVDSRSAEFEDESVYFEVVHRCAACGRMHVSATATAGGMAEAFRRDMYREMQRSGQFERGVRLDG